MRNWGLSLLAALLGLSAVAAMPMTAAPYQGAASCDETGRILFADFPARPAYIASVTKLMTALLVLEDVRAKKYDFFDEVTTTDAAQFSEPSWVGLHAGERMRVRDLLLALLVESANDAAIVLAVHSAGSLETFVARMNARAAALGMTRTTYYNPNGLPPNRSRHYPWTSFNVSTAEDQLKLARAILKYPEILEFTSVKTADLIKTSKGYRVNVTRQTNRPERKTRLGADERLIKTFVNHNNIMVKDKLKVVSPDGRECVDGLKTGYIEAGGSSIILTAREKGRRVIVAVLGSDKRLDVKGRVLRKSSEVRDEEARQLLLDALSSCSW